MITPSVFHPNQLAYDYTQIADNNLRTLAQRAAEEIKPRLRRATEDILIIGARLATIRQYLPHGQWLDWLSAEFEMHNNTARNFISVATRFADKSTIIVNLKPTALYALAAPSTPDDAIIEVQARIDAGSVPTVAETKQIIADHKPAGRSGLAAGVDAFQWLRFYQDGKGRTWKDLEDTQVYHANSLCFQAFVRAHPGLADHRSALRQALIDLRVHFRPVTADIDSLPPTDPNGGLMAEQVPAIATGKLLVDWTNEDWVAHTSESAAPAQSPNHPISQSPNLPPTDNIELSPDTELIRLQSLYGALSQMLGLLHQEHAQTAEDYGFGVEFQRLIADAKTLRVEIIHLTPNDRIT